VCGLYYHKIVQFSPSTQPTSATHVLVRL